MRDRAMQALYKLALAPVAETTADRNSYGFREGRGCADAVGAGFSALSKPNSATWILEADITGCYDNIIHQWMIDRIPMDKQILRKWLRAGYVENGRLYPTIKGTPQGGIISPTLANMTLDGLEETVHKAVPSRRSRVNFIRYADDFIITGKSKRLLVEKVRPAVEKFLSDRGLTLSREKTAITYIRDGFNFLGQNFRKYGNVLRIKPAKEGVLALIRELGTLIRKHVSAPMIALIRKLNEKLRGWANYHRHVIASEAFSHIDSYVYEQLWRMLRRRHQNKSVSWLIRNYWSASGLKHVFSMCCKTKKGQKIFQVLRISKIGIKRYVKVKADANPYLKEFGSYFYDRRHKRDSKHRSNLTARAFRARFA